MIKVNLGRTVATRGVIEAIKAAHGLEDVDPILFPLFKRHSEGDWGDLSHDDRQTNEDALECRARVISVYHTEKGITVWIITDPEWTITTALLPEDY